MLLGILVLQLVSHLCFHYPLLFYLLIFTILLFLFINITFWKEKILFFINILANRLHGNIAMHLFLGILVLQLVLHLCFHYPLLFYLLISTILLFLFINITFWKEKILFFINILVNRLHGNIAVYVC